MLVASVSGEWLLEMYVEEMCTLVDISGSSSSKSSISEAVLKCKEPVLLTPLELKLSIESELVALPVSPGRINRLELKLELADPDGLACWP